MTSEILVRTSERLAFRTCRWAWDQNFNAALQPKIKGPALRFGTLVHKAMEKRYKKGVRRGPRPATTFEKLYEAELKEAQDRFGFRDEDGKWNDAGEMGVSMLEHFVEVYGTDEEWKVLATEQPFQQRVHHPCKGCSGRGRKRRRRKVRGQSKTFMRTCEACDGTGKGEYFFTYVGVMDGLWENRMDLRQLVKDWKTTAKDPTKQTHLILDDQASAYWTFGVDWMLEQGYLELTGKLAGMLYTHMRKAKKDPRPTNKDGHHLNKDGTVSKNQPSPYFHRETIWRDEADRAKARQRAMDDVAEMFMVREGVLPVRKNPKFTNCPMCAYRDICELEETGSDWEAMRDATMVEWDPYSEHEIYIGR